MDINELIIKLEEFRAKGVETVEFLSSHYCIYQEPWLDYDECMPTRLTIEV